MFNINVKKIHCNHCNKDFEYYYNYCPICARKLTESRESIKGLDY